MNSVKASTVIAVEYLERAVQRKMLRVFFMVFNSVLFLNPISLLSRLFMYPSLINQRFELELKVSGWGVF